MTFLSIYMDIHPQPCYTHARQGDAGFPRHDGHPAYAAVHVYVARVIRNRGITSCTNSSIPAVCGKSTSRTMRYSTPRSTHACSCSATCAGVPTIGSVVYGDAAAI